MDRDVPKIKAYGAVIYALESLLKSDGIGFSILSNEFIGQEEKNDIKDSIMDIVDEIKATRTALFRT